MTQFNEIQTIKRRFFAFRNGVIADRLRKAGSPFRIIFGLNLPQIKEIAEQSGVDPKLAADLWSNNSTRESMLLAPMLVDPSHFEIAQARQWIASIPAAEIADVLCHSLLRKTSYARELMLECAEDFDMSRYVALRLAWHFLATDATLVVQIASQELKRDCNLTRYAAQQLLDEINFLEV